MDVIVTLIILIGGALLWSALDRITRLERRIESLEAGRDGIVADGANVIAGPETQSTQVVKAASPPPNAQMPVEQKIAAKEQRTARIASSAPIEIEPEAHAPVDAKTPRVIKVPARSASIQRASIEPEAVERQTKSFISEIKPAEDEFAFEEAPVRRGISFNFEDLFGRRLPIWAGGITLAIAGILIVKYAIDAGFFGRVFTPWVQSISGILFGAGLIAGAEFAHKNKDRVDDARVSQALSGAGIATLYGAFLVAGNVYGLISPLFAFFGMAAVTAAALWLSMRHGAPSALLGLAGGLAAPAMVGGISANVPLLAVYLALTIAGLSGVSRMQRWPWLALAGLIGGAGWSLWIILATSALDVMASLSVGGFVVLLAIALPMLALDGPRAAFMRSVAALVGAAQLALLVAIGGFIPLHWGLFALLAAAGQWLAWRDRDFDIVPTISLSLSAFLLLIWPEPSGAWLIVIGLSLAAIHAAPLLTKLWQNPSRLQLTLEYCGLAIMAPLIAMRHYLFESDSAYDGVISLVAAGAVALTAIALTRGWHREERFGDTRFALLTATMGALCALSAWFALPHWLAPIAVAVIAAALLVFGERARDGRIERVATSFAALTIPLLTLTTAPDLSELGTLVSGRGAGDFAQALIRWSGLAAVFALFSYRAKITPTRIAAHGVCGGLAYAMLSTLLPIWALPLGLAAVASVMLAISVKSINGFGKHNANIFALATLPLLIINLQSNWIEITRLFTGSDNSFGIYSLLRWGGLAGLFAAFAGFARGHITRIMAHWFAALMTYGTLAQIAPGWSLPVALSAVASGLLFLGLRREDRFVEAQSVLLGCGSLVLLLATGPAPIGQLGRLFGDVGSGIDALSLLRWGVVAALAVYFATKSRALAVRSVAQVFATLLTYGAVTQIVPITFVPLIAPVGLAILAYSSRHLVWPRLHAAIVAITGILVFWALAPMAIWLSDALLSLAGQPMVVDATKLSTFTVLKRLLLPATSLAFGIWLLRDQLPIWARRGGVFLAALIGGAALHSLYRLGFAQAIGDDFITYGVVQRLVWASLLIVVGSVLWSKGSGLLKTSAAPALIVAATLHTLYYSLALHNPLWTEQAVGAWPVINLILPLFALVPLGLYLLLPMQLAYLERGTRVVQAIHMIMIMLFAWATLRHAFHGTMLIMPGMGAAEDILRSILGITLAIGFLLWGIKAGRRDWRLASLLLMLLATVKVFLLDASGLDGLLRIGSFIALGFSLIGIGWLYSRQLGRDAAAAD